MRVLICLFFVLVLSVLAKAQSVHHYPTVRIHVPNHDLQLAIANGAAPDHGVHWIGDSLELPAFDVDMDMLAKSALGFRTIEATPYEPQLSARSDDNCALPLRFAVESPQNFELGSMDNGYYSFADTWNAFSEMRRLYPNLISERMAIDTFKTYEGREINYFRLSDNPDTQENEPRILLNALHHAREPMSLIQQIYFAWWLLENYGSDEEATWLIDNTELYLVPIVNPDGYAYNGAESSLSMGLWRKNRFPNSDGSFGIDLNRNYPLGFGGPGTSSDPSSSIYPGTTPLSEPETSALDFLHRELAFTTIVSAHSFGDLIIQPQLAEFDSETRAQTHQQILWAMRRDNRYGVGDSQQTVGYIASGNSDDHFGLYEAPGKTLAIACTPEIGQERFFFFPPREFVEPFAQDALLMNWRALQSVHFTPVAEVKNDFLEEEGILQISVVNASPVNGDSELRITSSDPAITFDVPSYQVTLEAGKTVQLNVPYRILGNAPTEIQELSIEFPQLNHIKPLLVEQLPVYESEVLYFQNMDNISSLFGFPLLSTGIVEHPKSLAIPEGFDFRQFDFPVNLYPGIKAIRVSYAHRFAFASQFPNVTLSAGNDTDGFEYYCTRQTTTNNPTDAPAYWGATPAFTYDSYVVDNSQDSGEFIVRWELERGFGPNYVYELDDILIEALVEADPISSTNELGSSAISVYPNPSSNGELTVLGIGEGATVQLHNSLGQTVLTTTIKQGKLDVSQFVKGQYYLTTIRAGKTEVVPISLH